ncbi:MAG: hypothetical protein LBH12_06280, partial [Dysgonamonadaceae bacterium]|nr:hypothetical protein [Dysgonamonadaceae bacterium]
ESDAVFQGVIEADKLEKSTQWRISSKRKWNLLKEYSFREDLRNGLIDPQGKMLAKNLNPTEVLEIIASLPD